MVQNTHYREENTQKKTCKTKNKKLRALQSGE